MPRSPMADDAARSERCHANNLEFHREQARWGGPKGEIVERDGVLLFAAGTAFPVLCNGVARLDPQVPADRVIDLADAWFAERGGRGYSLLGADLGIDADADLEVAAAARGLLSFGPSPAMVCEAPLEAAVVPDDIEVRWVGDGGRVEDMVTICDAAYQSLGMPAGVLTELVVAPTAVDQPHLRTVLLHGADGAALATAQLLVSHGIAGVYWVGTVEAARGRGLAELATRLVTNLGFEMGAPMVTLQASSMGAPIYRRMGYRDLYGTKTLCRWETTPA